VSDALSASPLDDETLASLRDAVAALPADELDVPTRVPELALLATVPDAATAFPIVRDTAVRAELAARGIPAESREPDTRHAGRAHTVWSIIALVLGLVAPALIMTGRSGGAALDPGTGALPSGIGMIVALGLFVLLEPGRTSGTLYAGGSLAGGTFIFFALLWVGATAITVAGGATDEVAGIVGVVLQLASAVGVGVLAVFAIRHDRARPQVTGGRTVPIAPGVPPELAASPEFRAGVDRRLADWRRHTETVLTAEERKRARAAEAEVRRLLAERGART
jgi:hypothetical protein